VETALKRYTMLPVYRVHKTSSARINYTPASLAPYCINVGDCATISATILTPPSVSRLVYAATTRSSPGTCRMAVISLYYACCSHHYVAPSPPVSSPLPRRSLIRKPQCKPRQKICPVFGSYTRGGPLTVSGYDCVDVHNDLESCGGCVDESRDGRRSEDGGRDCSAIPHIDAVRCEGNRCIIDSCRRGFVKSVDGEHCVPLQGGLHLQDPQFML